jgi:peptide/nickel transport system permease protein
VRVTVLRRLTQAVGVLWAAFTLSFVILYLLPGDAVLTKLGSAEGGINASTEQIAQARAQYGLDDPVLLQYGNRLLAALHGDFGQSISTGEDATQMVLSALPPTLAVTGLALVLAVVFGGGIAVLGTYTRARALSQLLLSLPPLGISLPTFWVGLLLIQVFSFQLRLLPALGSTGPESLILPAITLALPTGAIIGQVLAKSLRTQLAEPLHRDRQGEGREPQTSPLRTRSAQRGATRVDARRGRGGKPARRLGDHRNGVLPRRRRPSDVGGRHRPGHPGRPSGDRPRGVLLRDRQPDR